MYKAGKAEINLSYSFYPALSFILQSRRTKRSSVAKKYMCSFSKLLTFFLDKVPNYLPTFEIKGISTFPGKSSGLRIELTLVAIRVGMM